MILARLAARELARSAPRLILPILSLATAVAAHSAVSVLSSGITASMRAEARSMAGGDLEVSSTRPLSETERGAAIAALPSGTRSATVREFVSMARDPRSDRTRLVEVRVISSGYPFYGGVESDPPGILSSLGPGVAAAQPEILPQLGIDVGSEMQLGEARVRILGWVIREPGPTIGAFALGPRVWIDESALAATRLEQAGSRIRYRSVYKLPDATHSAASTPSDDELVAKARAALAAALPAAELRIRTYRESNPQLRGFYDRLGDFLALMSLFVFLLAGIGVGSALQSHLRNRRPTVAVLRCVGASGRQILAIFVGQALAIGAIGSALGVAMGAALGGVLPMLLGDLVDATQLSRHGSYGAYAQSFALGVSVTLVFALVALVELPTIRPLRLLRPDDAILLPGRKRVAAGLLAVGFMVTVGATATESPEFGAGTVASIIAFGGAVFALLYGALTLVSRLDLAYLPLVIRYGTRNLSRSRAQSALSMAVLSLGVLLLASIQVLRSGMLGELGGTRADERPQLFLIDVGDEERAGVEQRIRAEAPAARLNWNKLVRARLRSVDGEPVRRGEPGDDSGPPGRNREHNLSERLALYADAETVTDGEFWDGPLPEGAEPEVSVTDTFAERAGIRLGATLVFEIQGVELSARVTSLRRVRWSTFQPNFFLLFRPGSLAGAPFQWITSVGGMSGTGKSSIQSVLVRDFPTVTAIDIDEASRRLLAVAEQLESVIRFLSVFTLVAGLLILGMVAIENARARSAETALLKVLGGTRQVLAEIAGWEFALIGLLAAWAGAIGALGLGYGFLQRRFGIDPDLLTWDAMALLGFLVVATAVTGLLSSLGVFRVKPLEVLRS